MQLNLQELMSKEQTRGEFLSSEYQLEGQAKAAGEAFEAHLQRQALEVVQHAEMRLHTESAAASSFASEVELLRRRLAEVSLFEEQARQQQISEMSAFREQLLRQQESREEHLVSQLQMQQKVAAEQHQEFQLRFQSQAIEIAHL